MTGNVHDHQPAAFRRLTDGVQPVGFDQQIKHVFFSHAIGFGIGNSTDLTFRQDFARFGKTLSAQHLCLRFGLGLTQDQNALGLGLLLSGLFFAPRGDHAVKAVLHIQTDTGLINSTPTIS